MTTQTEYSKHRFQRLETVFDMNDKTVQIPMITAKSAL